MSRYISNKLFYINILINILANVRKIKNPKTSVAVVKNIDEDSAGSLFNLCNTNGVNNPKKPETIKLPIIAKNIINPKKKLPYIAQIINPVITPIIAPFIKPS